MTTRTRYLALFLPLLAPVNALAHGPHEEAGVVSTLTHAFTGPDHLLVLIGLGLWAGQQRSVSWVWPVSAVVFALSVLGGIHGLAIAALLFAMSSHSLASLISARWVSEKTARLTTAACLVGGAALSLY